MAVKYTNIFHGKTLQNLPKLRILVWKQTIWQPSGRLVFSKTVYANGMWTICWNPWCVI
jgi:hypothetical protein